MTEWGHPWDSLSKLHREMNRMFEDRFFGGRFTPAFVRRRSPFPRVNLAETPERFILTCELPGVSSESLDVSLSGRELTIKGERPAPPAPQESPDRKYHRRERGFGAFSRTIELPGEVESDCLSASLKRGVLTVELARSSGSRPRQIKVKAGQ